MAKLVVYTRTDGKWAWRLQADNNEIIATDGNQGYENETDAQTMADRIVRGEFKDAKRLRIPPKK